MSARVAVPTEVTPGERRVALVPAAVAKLVGRGVEVSVEAGAGIGSYFTDDEYAQAGARVVAATADVWQGADVVVKIQPPLAAEIDLLHAGQIVVGLLEPARDPARVGRLRDAGVTAFALELVPRITRAQSMDALTSQASVAGYRAALMAALGLGRFFPMLTTPAGTIRPAKVLVLGAGVAGLQAIATSRRLGAMVEAYDVRPVAREQVESLGAKFLSLDVDASAAGGYARELTAEERERQSALIGDHVAGSDAVITTAAIPGRRAPVLVTEEMVRGMRPGSVVVDLAAEGGGNCALTRPGETVERGGVTIFGPLNVPSLLPVNASETYARNISDFLGLLIHDGELSPAWDDEIVTASLLTRDGVVAHGPTRELLTKDAKDEPPASAADAAVAQPTDEPEGGR
ncbi:MAG TPA: Re/Si-specific NAD(P)(+) transhydrogenase subunit alpha [Thermoleophilia bacterium]|nr:Re/Si-specific NAD(P)(+) transhydrogenase subunit alpha [Thermoleophilia bacterium]